MAARVEIAETLYRELSQSRRVSRGLHGRNRQTDIGGNQAEMAAHRRILVPARRDSDRRVLADRQIAEGNVDPRSGRRTLSRARMRIVSLLGGALHRVRETQNVIPHP